VKSTGSDHSYETYGERIYHLQQEVSSLRKTVEALRSMIEIREDGSAYWRIPGERGHTDAEVLR
jgi:hypothetical protein